MGILDIKLRAAINEIDEIGQLPLDKNIIDTWLSDYYHLREEMRVEIGTDLPPLEMLHGCIKSEFDSVYRHLLNLMEWYNNEDKCVTALNEYHSILSGNSNVHDNIDLHQWLRKNESVDIAWEIAYPNNDDDSTYIIDRYGYYLSRNDYKKTLEFFQIFDHLFWEEKLLPDRIAQIREKEEQNRLKVLATREQNLTDEFYLLCDECKPLGYCKNHPPST